MKKAGWGGRPVSQCMLCGEGMSTSISLLALQSIGRCVSFSRELDVQKICTAFVFLQLHLYTFCRNALCIFFPWYREEFTLRMCCGEGGKVGPVAAVRGHY